MIFFIRYIKISIFSIILLFFTLHNAYAQIFNTAQNPPGLRWNQINTENFQIIYPRQMESEAQRLSGILDTLIEKVSISLNKHPHKISIILQNQGTIANGFVQLAPRRSEFFTTPPQEFDYQDWLNSLAVHELRHVVQFDKLTGKLKAPFFEDLALALFGIILPPWFYEGDAVGIETSLTNAGRGRQPEWDITFRTNTVVNRRFTYSKDFLGSLKDLTPGYYQLGYFMTTKLRRDYGSGIMDSIFKRISHNYLRPYNLSNSIKKYTGMNTAQLHDATVLELQKLWQEQLTKVKITDYPALNSRKNERPSSYLLPQILPSGEIIALRKSFDKVPAIITIDKNGIEHRIIKIGPQDNSHFSYAAGKIVWDELRYDTRFLKRSFNVINSYDLTKKVYKQLTNQTRMFAPTLSPDGKTIIAVNVSYSNKISLVELEAKTGRELKRYSSPENYMLQTPHFDSSGQKIIVVAVAAQGKALYEFNRFTGLFKELLPFQQQLISRPVYAEDQIIFKGHYNGIDNLYRLDTLTRQIYQITSVKSGAFNPFYDAQSKKLFFNNYQVDGFDISSLDLNAISGTHPGNNTSIEYEQPVVMQEGNSNVFNRLPDIKYHSESYREISNLFYFHSIIPIMEQNEFFDNYNFGLALKSDNKLNTLSFYSGYQFNNALKKNEYFAGFSYKRFYPILNITYINQGRLIYQRQSPGNEIIPITWRENAIDADVSVPFTFNRLNKLYFLEILTGTNYTSRYNVSNRIPTFIRTVNFPMHYRLTLNANTRRSGYDLAPPWGQNISIDFNNFPFGKQSQGELLSIRSNFFFPGMMQNHSFQVSFNYQHVSGAYNFNIDIPRVSGISHLKPTGLLRNTLLFDYRFPLSYPDWEIGPLAYIKRLKGGFFADFENIGKKNSFSPRTFGAELHADMNLLRFYLPNFDLVGKLILVNEKPRQNPILEFGIIYDY
jgi:hypothetical protein